MTNDHIPALERLAKLKADGNLTDEEYEAQKARFMGATTAVPLFRRLWFVVLLTCLLMTFPVALIILASGPVYKKGKDGPEPISKGSRLAYAGFLGLWIVALITKAIVHPGEWGPDTDKGAQQAKAAADGLQGALPSPVANNPAAPATAPNEAAETAEKAPAAATEPPACSDPKLRRLVLEGINRGLDQAAIQRAEPIEAIPENLIERSDNLALTGRRSFAANSQEGVKLEETRMCVTAEDSSSRGFGTVVVIQHGGKLGGYILNIGLPQPTPFGDEIN